MVLSMKPKSTIIDGLGKSSIIFCAIRPERGRHACTSARSTAVKRLSAEGGEEAAWQGY